MSGATGFLGRAMVGALLRDGGEVLAGVRTTSPSHGIFHGAKLVHFDVEDRQSVLDAMAGVDEFYHFAGLVDPTAPRSLLFHVNAKCTRTVWEAASSCGVSRALYCSSAAVYGLLARNMQPITEDVLPRAVEPYGRSKVAGEKEALKIAGSGGPVTVVIRPVAVFGPGDRTAFGRALRRAFATRLLMPGKLRGSQFSFVHVQDVAAAATHLMRAVDPLDSAYNIAVEPPITFDKAFDEYLVALARSPRRLHRARILANLSKLVHRLPDPLLPLARAWADRWLYEIGGPGAGVVFSSRRLLQTSFHYSWTSFADILSSCIDPLQ